MSASPAYDGYPWAEDFWKEQRAYMKSLDSSLHYEPFRMWSWGKSQGKYINVDDTPMGRVRATVEHLRDDCTPEQTTEVWFFGGSTAWGYGDPDFATIPSYLSEKLSAQQACVEVTNLGVEGFDSNQELIYLTQELKAGRRPNLVIFYDGYNDAISGAVNPAQPYAHWYFQEFKTRFESRGLSLRVIAGESHLMDLLMAASSHLGPRSHLEAPAGEIEARAKATLENYMANVTLARALAKKYGFEVRFFWHPMIYYGDKPSGPFEAMASKLAAGAQPSVRAVYEEAAKSSADSHGFIFLGNIFTGVSDPIYVDQVHLGPRGNQIVAEAIASELSKTTEPPEKTPAPKP